MGKQQTVKINNVYCADFETTSYENYKIDGQVRVFLWSLVRVSDKKAWYGFDIKSFLVQVALLNCKIVFFHNLKFDGHYLLDYLVRHNQKFEIIAPNGVWFKLTYNGTEYRDSYKKFKMSVYALSVFLKMPLKIDVRDSEDKKPWDYYIPDNYIPDLKTIEYCIHDSRIVAHAIELDWINNRTRLTNSSESYHNCKNKLKDFDLLFPQLDEQTDDFARLTYKGGFCSINQKYANQDLERIYAYDVNGLYSYVMWNKDIRLPYGVPYPDEKVSENDYQFIDFYCEFDIKDKHVPTLQIKNNSMYAGMETQYLTESNGITHLHLTETDYETLHRQYHVYNEFGHTFNSYHTKKGLLHDIIQENIEQKTYYSQPDTYDEYLRSVAKDNMNMLYGSFGLSLKADIVTPYINERDSISFEHKTEIRKGRYIPIASAITSYAREITQKAVQSNYSNWIYSDTDSMYLTRPAHNIKIHHEKSGYWSHDTPNDDLDYYETGKFLRQKAYCLADTKHEFYKKYSKYKPKGEYDVSLKCAGMPDSVKQIMTWDKFYLGSEIGNRLIARVVKGGVCLIPSPYKIKESAIYGNDRDD